MRCLEFAGSASGDLHKLGCYFREVNRAPVKKGRGKNEAEEREREKKGVVGSLGNGPREKVRDR